MSSQPFSYAASTRSSSRCAPGPGRPCSSMATRRPVRSSRYRKRLPVVFGVSDAGQSAGFTTNVSATGLGLQTAHVWPVGTQLFLRLAMPGGRTCHAHGVVAWSQTSLRHEASNGQMGLRLLGADESFFRGLLALERGAGGGLHASP